MDLRRAQPVHDVVLLGNCRPPVRRSHRLAWKWCSMDFSTLSTSITIGQIATTRSSTIAGGPGGPAPLGSARHHEVIHGGLASGLGRQEGGDGVHGPDG